jgi:hypothetical protein
VLQNNAPSHVVLTVKDTLHSMLWKVLHHPPYNLTFHRVKALKRHLWRQGRGGAVSAAAGQALLARVCQCYTSLNAYGTFFGGGYTPLLFHPKQFPNVLIWANTLDMSQACKVLSGSHRPTHTHTVTKTKGDVKRLGLELVRGKSSVRALIRIFHGACTRSE